MRKVQGLICVILSAIIYGLTPIIGRLSFDHGSNPINLSFMRACLALPFLYLWMKLSGTPQRLTWRRFGQITLLSLVGSAATNVMLYASYQSISVGLATTLHFVYPVVVTLGEACWKRQRLTPIKGAALLCALAGILFLYDPDRVELLGVALALVSGATYGFYLLYLAATELDQMHPASLTFYTCLLNSLAIGLLGGLTHQITFALDAVGWIETLTVSLLTAFGGVALLQIGVRLSGASTAAIVSTFEPLVSVILGVIILNEALTTAKVTGSALIVLAVLILTLAPVIQMRLRQGKTEPN